MDLSDTVSCQNLAALKFAAETLRVSPEYLPVQVCVVVPVPGPGVVRLNEFCTDSPLPPVADGSNVAGFVVFATAGADPPPSAARVSLPSGSGSFAVTHQ